MQDKKRTYYITTPIYYPSDKLHIGHAYSTTIADTLARYKRLQGYDVFFLTGSDEHGQKIEKKAKENQVTPLAYVDKIVASFQSLWQKLNISNDDFIRTTEKRHEKVVQEILRRIYQKGDIYKGIYQGYYCTPCESYFTERQLGIDHTCPDCKRKVEKIEEEAYFFRLSNYQDRLLKHIEEHPDFIEPATRKNEMLNFIRQGLEDLCITRTSFSWGIPLPKEIETSENTKKHIVYVWFDALTNYLTPIGFLDDEAKFRRFWPCDLHLVGKEIVRFHTIIWPSILMALDLPLPKKVYGHGWLITDGEKMSKSKGNVVDPLKLIDEFGEEALRFFLMREIKLGQDGNFSRDALIKRINADLANDLGNLLYRTLTMIEKYTDNKIPKSSTNNDKREEIEHLAQKTVQDYTEEMDKMEITTALSTLFTFVSRVNKYIDESEPWKLAKEDKKALSTVLYTLAESLRLIAILLLPVMPKTSTSILDQLGVEHEHLDFQKDTTWGKTKPDTTVKKQKPLFPRIEVKEK